MTTPAGWYADDPQHPARLRWWDGSQWTEHRRGGADEPSTASDDPEITLPSSILKERNSGLFGGKKALEAENAELRSALDALGAVERESLRREVAELRIQSDQARQQLDDLQRTVIATSEAAILQEVGVYDYVHPLGSAVEYKARLDSISNRIKQQVKGGSAVTVNTHWQVNGSKAQGQKMVRDIAKLMLRAYNNEADHAVRSMRPYRLDAAVKRMDTAQRTISRLGTTMGIAITEGYHRLRIEELELTADYLAKVAEEKEAEREEKARLREEAQAQKEFEREKARLLKEQAHYQAAVAKMRESGQDSSEAEAKLAEIGDAIEGVEARSANIRAGYVYVISNYGAFGDQMLKVGMTRRLDPMDRVRELGDASVPFRYDVHAIVFSSDAVGLETALHQQLAPYRVNKINHRREFFYTTAQQVRELLQALVHDSTLLEYQDEPEALEWRQSASIQEQAGQ